MIEKNYSGILAARLNKTANDETEIVKFTTWALANLNRGNVLNREMQTVAVFSFLKVILNQNDLEIVEEAIHALADLVDEDEVKLIVDSNILQKLQKISKSAPPALLSSIFEIVNQVSYSESQESSKAIIESGFVDRIYQVLNDDIIQVSIKKDCLWILSNLTVENSAIISQVVNTIEKFQIIARYCSHQNEGVKAEAIHTLCNITSKGNLEQKQFLIDNGIFKMFYSNLSMDTKVKTILTILEALDNILKDILTMREDLEDYVRDLMEDCGIVECLEALLEHQSSKVYQQSLDIIENYFDIEQAF